MSPHTQEISSNASSCPTHGNEQICLRLRVIAGWLITRMLLASSHRAIQTRLRPNRLQSTLVSPCVCKLKQASMLTFFQKTRSSNNRPLPEAHPFANQQSRTQRPQPRTAVFRQSANKSIPHPQRNPRRLGTPSAEPSKSNMLHLRRRPQEARLHHLQRRHLEDAARRPKVHPQTVTNRPQVPNHPVLPVLHTVRPEDRSPKDPFPTIQLSAPHLPRVIVLLRVVLWVLRDCHLEATLTGSPLWRPSLRRTPRAASPNQRASNTRSQHRMLNQMFLTLRSLLPLADRARNECSRYNWGRLVQRVVTDVQTLSLRLLDV
jgi:hypothetical protein